MAESKRIILEIDVNDKDVQSLNSELERTQKNFKDTQREADKTSKSLKDVGDNGGAIAILDELTGGMATRVRDAAEATKLFNFSLKGLRGALIATGIGAIVVAAGLLVAYWDDITDAIGLSNKELEKQLDLLDKNIEANNLIVESLNLRLEAQKLLDKDTSKTLKQLDDALKKEQEYLLAKEQGLRYQRSLILAKQTELSLSQQIANTELIRMGQEPLEVQNKLTEEQKASLDELNKQILETRNAYKQLGIERANLTKEEDDAREKGKETPLVESIFGTKKLEEGSIEFTNGLDRLMQGYISQRQSVIEAAIQQDTEYTRTAEELANFRMDLTEKEALTTEELLGVVGNALNGLSALAGENAGIQKAIGVAQAIIDTYIGANKALAQGGIVGGVAAGAIIATGLANVSTILSTKIPSVGSNVSTPSVGGRGAIAQPSFNVVGNTGVNQLANVVGEQFNKPVKAYITTGDVSSAQQLENDTVSNASLG